MTAPTLWSWSELCQAVQAPVRPGPDVFGIIVDSRQAQPGDLFIALPGDPGERFNPSYRSDIDGHDFVGDALSRGAVGAMVHRAVAGTANLLAVSDTYDGLWSLGRAARARLAGDVVAVTGSSGKTTFKTFLAAALGGYASPGSFNNHIGVPLSLANAPLGAQGWVFEVGTNHPGEIEPLSNMIAADVAVLLNVHDAHIENFGSHDNILKEKISIFSGLSPISKRVCEYSLASFVDAETYTFGLDSRADAHIEKIEGDLLQGRLFGAAFQARIPGGGAHRATTLLAALLTTRLLERDLTEGCDLPADLVPAGRGNVTLVEGIEIVDDSYNANPASMLAAIDAFLGAPAPGRRIGVFGQMAELGDASRAGHLRVAEQFARFDRVITVGPAFRDIPTAAWFATATDDLIDAVSGQLRAGDRLLVKGSNGVFWTSRFVPRLITRIEHGSSSV